MAEFKNHVLSTLTRDEIALLSPLRSIELHVGDYLLHAGDRVEQAVFPESGVISLITDIGGGSAIEIAMIGREGCLEARWSRAMAEPPPTFWCRYPATAIQFRAVDFYMRSLKARG
jgi:hypothetical protein